MIKLFINLLILTSTLFSTSIFADDWQLDPSTSQLNFISIKKGNIAEVHQFNHMEGVYNTNGVLTLEIDLASVDTANPVRDERMKRHLFGVNGACSKAVLSATIDTERVDAIAEGASEKMTVEGVLELNGETKNLAIDVIITRLVGAKLSVVSAKPVLLNVGDFSLVSGVAKLMELAKLPSISHAVPVTFYLTFELKR